MKNDTYSNPFVVRNNSIYRFRKFFKNWGGIILAFLILGSISLIGTKPIVEGLFVLDLQIIKSIPIISNDLNTMLLFVLGTYTSIIVGILIFLFNVINNNDTVKGSFLIKYTRLPSLVVFHILVVFLMLFEERNVFFVAIVIFEGWEIFTNLIRLTTLLTNKLKMNANVRDFYLDMMTKILRDLSKSKVFIEKQNSEIIDRIRAFTELNDNIDMSLLMYGDERLKSVSLDVGNNHVIKFNVSKYTNILSTVNWDRKIYIPYLHLGKSFVDDRIYFYNEDEEKIKNIINDLKKTIKHHFIENGNEESKYLVEGFYSSQDAKIEFAVLTVSLQDLMQRNSITDFKYFMETYNLVIHKYYEMIDGGVVNKDLNLEIIITELNTLFESCITNTKQVFLTEYLRVLRSLVEISQTKDDLTTLKRLMFLYSRNYYVALSNSYFEQKNNIYFQFNQLVDYTLFSRRRLQYVDPKTAIGIQEQVLNNYIFFLKQAIEFYDVSEIKKYSSRILRCSDNSTFEKLRRESLEETRFLERRKYSSFVTLGMLVGTLYMFDKRSLISRKEELDFVNGWFSKLNFTERELFGMFTTPPHAEKLDFFSWERNLIENDGMYTPVLDDYYKLCLLKTISLKSNGFTSRNFDTSGHIEGVISLLRDDGSLMSFIDELIDGKYSEVLSFIDLEISTVTKEYVASYREELITTNENTIMNAEIDNEVVKRIVDELYSDKREVTENNLVSVLNEETQIVSVNRFSDSFSTFEYWNNFLRNSLTTNSTSGIQFTGYSYYLNEFIYNEIDVKEENLSLNQSSKYIQNLPINSLIILFNCSASYIDSLFNIPKELKYDRRKYIEKNFRVSILKSSGRDPKILIIRKPSDKRILVLNNGKLEYEVLDFLNDKKALEGVIYSYSRVNPSATREDIDRITKEAKLNVSIRVKDFIDITDLEEDSFKIKIDEKW